MLALPVLEQRLDGQIAGGDGCTVLVAAAEATVYAGQVKLVTKLLAKTPNIVIVSVRTPYDIKVLPRVSTVLAAYGSNAPALRAIADVLMGAVEPSGVLPVTLS